MKIIADNTVPYLKGILEPIADVSYLDSKEFTPTNIKDADALIVRSIDKCTCELLEGSRVRLITTATIGYDHIDIHYCEKAGITWKNAPGCNAASVGQYVLSSLVAVALRKGERLAGKTIGIVGVGHVGSIVERLCEAMGMRVLRNDPPRAEQEGDGWIRILGHDRERGGYHNLACAVDQRGTFRHPPSRRSCFFRQIGTKTMVYQQLPGRRTSIRRPYCRPNEPARSAN